MAPPTLGELRDAIASTLLSSVPGLVEVYPRVADAVSVPCVVVVPTSATFGFTKADPDDDWPFDLNVLVPRTDTELAQTTLDGYVSSGGERSIREAVMRFPNLGIEGPEASVRARVTGMSNYGGFFEAAGVDHVGATLGLLVTIRGPRLR